MKKLVLLFLVLGLSVVIGQAQTIVQATEVAANDMAPNANHDLGTRDPGDFLFDLDMQTLTGDIRLLGVESDDTDWYLTGARDYAGCYFYQVDYAGTTVLNMVATGHTGWGWRDLGYDGTYLYASDSYDLEQIDPATGTATGVVIPGPISPVRAVAYDSATDTFWTASFSSDLYQFDRSGTVLQTITNPGLAMYGAAMDESSNTLWWWSQDGSGTLASAMDPTTGTFTGDTWDGGTNTWPGVAGGACIYDDPTYGLAFAGMHQATPDNVAVYDIKPNPLPQLDVKVNGQDAGVIIADTQNVKIDIDVEARQFAGCPVDVWVAGKTPYGVFCYDGTGPYAGWNLGLGNAFYTGPLTDMTATVHDHTLPVGSYKVYLSLDTIANGKRNFGALFGTDACDFDVIQFSGFFEDFEDGVADGWVPDGPHWYVDHGVYYLDCPSYADWISYYGTFDYSDFTYYADMRMVDTGNTSDTYDRGVLFRCDGTMMNGYEFQMSNDGYVHLYVHVNSSSGTSLYSAVSPNMIQGVGNWNNVSVDARGSNLDVYINGVLDFTIVDTTWTTGKVALWGQGSGIYDHEYEYDNVGLDL